MKRLMTILTIAGIVGVSSPAALASPNPPACPAGGDHVVELSDRQLLGWNNTEDRLGPFPADIPAGTYQLTLASFDDHSAKPDQGHHQPAEVWWLSVLDDSGTEIVRSSTTPDLAAEVDLAVFSMGIVELTSDASALVARHGFYDAYNPNSVVPLCATFTTVAPPAVADVASSPEPVPPPAPRPAPDVAPAALAADIAPATGPAAAPPAVADPVPPASVKGISVSVQPQLSELPNTGIHETVALVACVALALGLGLLRIAPTPAGARSR